LWSSSGTYRTAGGGPEGSGWVAFEYAKVRLLYVDLKIPERTEIDWFDDGHVINAVKTFPFLDRHLNWTPTFREEKG
jgi:hypothetical protein